ncbi:hypothetical protein TNCV_1342801 [Trichonephila clavipes]|nr:hypothetical protein TNCV_1342801 [Trichonephila clavipes]
MILSSTKWRNSTCFTQRERCGGAPSGIILVVVSHRLACRFQMVAVNGGQHIHAFAAWGTLNSRRATSPFVWLVEGVERWETPDHLQVSSLKIGVETSQSYWHLYGAQSYG